MNANNSQNTAASSDISSQAFHLHPANAQPTPSTNNSATNNPSILVNSQLSPSDGLSKKAASLGHIKIVTPKHHQEQEKEKHQSYYSHAVSLSSRDVKRRPAVNETVFKVNKGVKVFDFSFEKNLLVCGG